MNQLARTLELAGLFESAQLEEAKDPAASILASLAAVRTLGFTKDSAADTPGVKRMWMIQKKMKYDFSKEEGFKAFEKDLKAALPDMKLTFKKKDWAGGADQVRGSGFLIDTQQQDRPGQIVLQVPKGNKSGDLYRSGFDT